VPDLHAAICETGQVGYTTVLKRVQRMEEKGYLKRGPREGRAHTYEAVYQPENTRASLLGRLIHSAFNDSPNELIQHAIGGNDLSTQDIADIRALLDRVEKGK